MPVGSKAPRPDMAYININTIESDIDDCIINFFSQYDINIFDMSQRKLITHNLLTLAMMNVYKTLFKPNQSMINNQKSLIDYDNIDMLTVIANKFIELSLMFNKSLGLMQFSLFTGIHRSTLAEWRDNKQLNPARSDVINNICECHKMEQIGLLNDTPVGALAVANNDIETGLEWSTKQALNNTAAAVYILPTERTNRLQLAAPDQSQVLAIPDTSDKDKVLTS